MAARVDHAAALLLPPHERKGGNLFWSAVDRVSDKADKMCRCCRRHFAGGVPRIKIHLLGRRAGSGVAPCTFLNADRQIQDEFIAILAEAEKRANVDKIAESRRAQTFDDGAVADVAASALVSSHAGSSSGIDLTQPTIARVFLAQGGKIPTVAEVDQQWSKAMVATGTPFNHVDNPEFRKAVLMTALAGQGYVRMDQSNQQLAPKLPKRNALSGPLLDATDRLCTESVNALKAATIKDTGCTITSDGMSNLKNQPLVNILNITPSGTFFVRLVNGEGETKDNEWIASRVIESIESEGPGNVVMVVMDGACRGSFPFISAKYPHIICQVCVAHALDLLLEDFAKEGTQGPVVAGEGRFRFDTSWTRDRLAAGRKVVKFITNHQKPLAFYRHIVDKTPKEQLPKGGSELLKPAATRFGTEYIAADRERSCRSLLEQLVVSSEWAAWCAAQSADTKLKAAEVKALVLAGAHWDELITIVEASTPIFCLLRLCDCARALARARPARARSARVRAARPRSLTHSLASLPANRPSLSKIYMRMMATDQQLADGDIPNFPDERREEWHELFLARWRYFHHPAQVAAAFVDLEYWDRDWTKVPDEGSDEPSECAQFEKIVEQLALTPGAAEHKVVDMMSEYDNWIECMKLAGVGDKPVITKEKLDAARRMPTWKWWQTFGKSWPHLRWFAMRLTAQICSACPCERNWSAYEWIHSKKRNQLGITRAERLVRSFSNINLMRKHQEVSNDFVQWDLEMLNDDPDPDDDDDDVVEVTVRSSPRLAAGRAARAPARGRGGRCASLFS
jgi:hypothetical protein